MILWVDDDSELVLESFFDELRDAGFEILPAKNPDEMWDCLIAGPIEGIIMDIMLPTGDSVDLSSSKMGILTGLRLLEKIYAEEQYQNIPSIIFTILNDQEVQDWANDNNIPLLRKQDTLPCELLEAVEKAGMRREGA